MRCVNCKNCINFVDGYYWCCIGDETDYVEEAVANDDNLGCEFYDEDRDDDTAA